MLSLTGAQPVGASEREEQAFFASTLIFIGLIMTVVACCGIALYALSVIYEIAIVQRHARKIEKMRQLGKIE